MQKITDIKDLKKKASKKQLECFIVLGAGVLKSSKDIFYNPQTKKFAVFNGVNGYFQHYTEKQLSKETNIVEAIEKGCFYQY